MLFRSGKQLEKFWYIGNHYLCSIDGTGFFSSHKVHCDNCCEKHHKNGSTTYYHQMFCGAIVHPDQKTVIPFPPEPIMKGSGNNKNDCEFYNQTQKKIILMEIITWII